MANENLDGSLPPSVVKVVRDHARELGIGVNEYLRRVALAGEGAPALRDLIATHNTVEEVTRKRDEAREDLLGLLGPDMVEQVRLAEQKLRHVVTPPPTSAGNVDTLLMSWAYLYAPFFGDVDDPAGASRVIGAIAASPKLWEFQEKKFSAFNDLMSAKGLARFAKLWLGAAFARLEVSHKLAAALCLTDVPDDMEVRAPWPAWSLLIPDGLFPDVVGSTRDGEPVQDPLARVWIVGTTVFALVTRKGGIAELLGSELGSAGVALRNLIRGACLALSNPEDFKKEHRHRPSARSPKRRDLGAPDLDQAKFLLSAPVTVDFREHLRESLSGDRAGSSPKAQFLVRGHWRNQAHGPKHALRKTVWIEPFWKGDPDARVLLRQHKVDPES